MIALALWPAVSHYYAMFRMKVHHEVKTALDEGRPVVALESTVITHGLPYPQNVETAVQMETAVRAGGAVPATIAILAGIVHIGLTAEDLEHLGQQAGDDVRKCSRRDLPLAIAPQRKWGHHRGWHHDLSP